MKSLCVISLLAAVFISQQIYAAPIYSHAPKCNRFDIVTECSLMKKKADCETKVEKFTTPRDESKGNRCMWLLKTTGGYSCQISNNIVPC